MRTPVILSFLVFYIVSGVTVAAASPDQAAQHGIEREQGIGEQGENQENQDQGDYQVNRQKNQRARLRLLEALLEERELPYELATGRLNISAATVKAMQEQGLLRVIRERVPEGVPYVGWSAGSNVACPTICTTNDMPIVEPATFTAAGLVPFQINPHYTDAHPDGHAGETREQRLLEYVEANPCMTVAGLREGCILRVENGRIELIGERPMRIFRKGQAPYEVRPGDDLNFLLD